MLDVTEEKDKGLAIIWSATLDVVVLDDPRDAYDAMESAMSRGLKSSAFEVREVVHLP